jgi:hypothetical protein
MWACLQEHLSGLAEAAESTRVALAAAEGEREALLAERDLSSSNLEVVVKIKQVRMTVFVCGSACLCVMSGAGPLLYIPVFAD